MYIVTGAHNEKWAPDCNHAHTHVHGQYACIHTCTCIPGSLLTPNTALVEPEDETRLTYYKVRAYMYMCMYHTTIFNIYMYTLHMSPMNTKIKKINPNTTVKPTLR